MSEEIQSSETENVSVRVEEKPRIVRISPSVRKLIAEHGIDPTLIEGTGKNGAIKKVDVLKYLAEDPALPIRVIVGGEWVDETEEVEGSEEELPKVPQVDERTQFILEVLEGNAKSVVAAIKQAESTETLDLIFDLESANKKRKTVLDAVRKRLAYLTEAAKPKETKEPKKPKEPEIFVHGNIKEVRGSLWEDDAGNLYVLAGKVGEPSGVFSLRPTRRTSRRSRHLTGR